MAPWTPETWREKPIAQQPEYADSGALAAAIDTVTRLPPIVAPGEVDALREQLARASRGEAFVLQGGDCAERFDDCTARAIENKLKILLQMSLVLTWGARMPVVRLARMAGQFAKPRSKNTEQIDGVEVPAYRGDHVNGHPLNQRAPDPQRMVQAYFHAAATLNYARALLDGGFADLHHPDTWDLDFLATASRGARYRDVLDRLADSLDFLGATGIRDDAALRTAALFTSHEGLLLPWEQAHTVFTPAGWYNLGAHFLWIGERTRALDGAHVDYFRGIANPIGVKIGPTTQPRDLLALLNALDPDDTPGRLTIITRLGADQVDNALPPLVAAVRATGRKPVWSCDPMHGNTTTTNNGFKTRDVDAILSELRGAMAVHDRLGGHLGGVHFELTGDNVTECTGGPEGLSPSDLARSYETFCDPRLNYAQSMELAFLLAERLRDTIHR